MTAHKKAAHKGPSLPQVALGGEAVTTIMELVAHHGNFAHAESLAPRMAGLAQLGEGHGAAGNAARGLGAVAGPLAILTGGVELGHASHAWHEGETEEAFRAGAAGTTTLLGGSATTATSLLGAEAVGGAVANAGPVAAAFGGGLAAGHAMDEAARSSGRYTETRGGQGLDAPSHEVALSGSEYGGMRGVEARDRMIAAGAPEWMADAYGAREAMSESLDAAFVGTGASIVDAFSSWFD